MQKLSEAEILERLPKAKDWERHGDMLVRYVAISIVSPRDGIRESSCGLERESRPPSRHRSSAIARCASKCPLTTLGGFTELDFALVGEINELPTDR